MDGRGYKTMKDSDYPGLLDNLDRRKVHIRSELNNKEIMAPMYSSCPSVSVKEKHYLPEKSGIYFFVNESKKEVLYVGRTLTSIKERIRSHKTLKQSESDRIYFLTDINTEYIPCSKVENQGRCYPSRTIKEINICLLEDFYIQMYRPALNKKI